MRKGTIKVMVGRTGTRIQEELDGNIKVWSAEDWGKELKRRAKEDKPIKKEQKEDSIKLPDMEETAAEEPKNKTKGIKAKGQSSRRGSASSSHD